MSFSHAFIISCCALLLASQALALPVSRTADPNDWKNNPLLKDAPKDIFDRLIQTRAQIEQDGCDVNVCFAVDGSGSISSTDFTIQKNFVDLISNIISTDKPVSFCAVQYSTFTSPISPLTDNRVQFFGKVRGAKQAGGGTNLAAGLGYTTVQLFTKVGDANKIIILGDGMSNLGFAPQFIAAPFLATGGSISAIAVGSSSAVELAKVTGDAEKVFYIAEFNLLINLINNIVKQTCALQ